MEIKVLLGENAKMLEKAQEIKHKDGYYNCECYFCGKPLHRKPSTLQKRKHVFCCKEHVDKWKETAYKGNGNHQYGVKGNKNGTWKSDMRITRYGYRVIRVLDHPFRTKDDFVLEHRLVAEKYLLNENNSIIVNGKRYLKDGYVVHHKDFDRLNNDKSNLLVMEEGEHQRFHLKLNKNEKNEKGQFCKKASLSTLKRIEEGIEMPKTSGNSKTEEYVIKIDFGDKTILKPGQTKIFHTKLEAAVRNGNIGIVTPSEYICNFLGLYENLILFSADRMAMGEIQIALFNNTKEDRVLSGKMESCILRIYETPKIELRLCEGF